MASGDRMPSRQNRPATLSEQLANSRQSLAEVTPDSDGPAESNLASDQARGQAFIQVAFQDTTPESPSANSAQAKLAQQPDDAPPVAPPLPTIPGAPTPLPGLETRGVPLPALPAEQIPEEIMPGVEAAPLNQRVVTLEDVLSSVENHFPLLIAAAAEQQVADGKLLAAQGAFDLQARASTINQPLGFYQNYRAGALLSQPLYDSGGYLYGGYKLGRGDFPTWYKDRQTDGNGEYAVGFGLPLLQNRQIDKRRAELFQADLNSQAVEPMVRTQLIFFSRDAAHAYWYWVALGQTMQVARNQLQLAEARVQQIALRVEKGDLPEIATIDNDRFIAARQTKLIEANRKFQAASIKLSLFLRTPDGQPFLPGASQLPADFPTVVDFTEANFDGDLAEAIAARPEIRELDFELEKVNVDLAAAENQMLPKLDAIVEASKDTGTPASFIEDKTPFEMEAGLLAEVPLQRREARGKFRAAQGKQAQLMAKREFIVNKITTGLQDAYSAILNAHDRFEQARINKNLAIRSLEIGRQQFQAGDIDLIVLNIYEQAEAEAELQVIDAEAEYFSALADYHAAIGQVR
jgi:outer membrane protein TolC